MELINQLSDSFAYALHTATYNPDAEKFAKEKAAATKKEADAKQEKSDKEKAQQEKALAEQKAADERQKAEQARKDRATFSITRMFGSTLGIMFTILLVFLLVVFAVFGSSLAVNLNVHKPMAYKILYAIYGFLFFFLVIPYVLLYRWFWMGKRPKFYSLIPIIPYRINNPWLALFISWMSYKPDDDVELLKEWEIPAK